MNSTPAVDNRIAEMNVCVIVPTYNNHKTLRRVIDGLLLQTTHVIAVNDGSTDTTKEILDSYPQITVIHVPVNKGKGNALRQGFKKAKELNYKFAITIDSDGQHFPDDIPVFLDALEQEGTDVLLIGSRNMNQDSVPKKSNFGNKFSNFWFWFETGIKLDDTQSGYRLYPLESIPKRFVTKKFEFEIEVIVRTAWNGVPVKNIPVKILYDPAERVSHFRPFKDFTRISILNTVLVISLLYIIPRNFILRLKKKSIRQFIREDIIGSEDSNVKKACSIALGIFIGISPFWGFHTAIVLFLAVLLKWNKLLAFTFSQISIPPLIPFVIYGSLKMGSFLMPQNTLNLSENKITFELVKNNLSLYIAGSLTLAAVMATVFGLTSYLLLSLVGKSRKQTNA